VRKKRGERTVTKWRRQIRNEMKRKKKDIKVYK
jgi:hypothetical protein